MTDGVTMHALRVAAWLMSAFRSTDCAKFGLAGHQVYHGRGVSQHGDFCAGGERASQRLRRGAQPWLESSCGPACLAQRRATLHVFSEADARTVSFPAARMGLTDLAVSRGCGEARYEVSVASRGDQEGVCHPRAEEVPCATVSCRWPDVLTCGREYRGWRHSLCVASLVKYISSVLQC